ncbi:MAG: DUF4397 domain-containing protein [Chloroherpetonaceae bacterium]|nr:DUF4397 domain-containing protein [Chloroherpetonaceae bacterium]MCS7210940.1 DUF4397 domain-containing protein [Chloroherpetonaceae bacterium]MDW8019106.1 DUF4397 domain-containing protein [Chloroherpetonaceae bacterium]MDW8466953.1 DUF4397 domain-containing protein [Chloroherpetonaceae bacterium]
MVKKLIAKKSVTFSLLLSVLFIYASCSSSSGPSVSRAKILVTHASPNTPTVNLVIDNDVVGGNTPARLSFTQSTRVETDPGTRRIRVRLDGINPPVDILDIQNLTLAEGKDYSLYVIDTLVGVSNLKTLFITDDLTAPPSGQAGVRFLHLSPDAPAVDFVTFTGTPGLPQNVQPITNGTNRTFNRTVTSAQTTFVNIPAGSRVGVRLAGTTGSLIGEFTIPGGSSGVAAGRLYTFCVMGLARPGAPPAQSLTLVATVNN